MWTLLTVGAVVLVGLILVAVVLAWLDIRALTKKLPCRDFPPLPSNCTTRLGAVRDAPGDTASSDPVKPFASVECNAGARSSLIVAT